MGRKHTLVEYRLKEFELEQALRGLKRQQDGLDYKLDVEFYLKLEALTQDFGYTLNQVFDLLLVRHGGAGNGAKADADGLRARTNTELLGMIQRLEAASPSPLVSQNESIYSVSSHPGRGDGEACGSSSRLSANVDRALVDLSEVDGADHGIEEKIND